MNIGTILAICGMAAVAFYVLKPPAAPTGFERLSGRVGYITDGDTLYVRGYEAPVRIWGVNAPETTEGGWHEARSFLLREVYRQPVTCEIMHYDRYGRTVARCYLSDGRDVGGMLIEAGHAVEVHRFSKGYYSRRS